VLEDDQIFLHRQERELEQRGGSAALTRSCYLATGADGYVRALHEWVVDHGGEPFPGEPLPHRLSDEELLDRWHSHSEDCRSCRGADRSLSLAERGGALTAAVAALGSAWNGATPTGLALLGGGLLAAGLTLRARGWRRDLRSGARVPPRNR